MAYMTDAEAERLDEFFTKNTILPLPDSIGTVTRLKQSLRPGEPLFTKCIILNDEDDLEDVFDDAAEIDECELATAANA